MNSGHLRLVASGTLSLSRARSLPPLPPETAPFGSATLWSVTFESMVLPLKRRAGLAVAVLLWLLGTCLLALSPLAYFASGASDNATETGRLALAAVPALFVWPALVLAIALAHRGPGQATRLALSLGARRASLLMLLAGAILLLARHLGKTVAIHGDTTWTVFWTFVVVVWGVVSTIAIRRSPRRPSQHAGAAPGDQRASPGRELDTPFRPD